MWGARLLAPCLLAVAASAFAQDDYNFDVSQFEKKPFEFGGYAELRAENFRLDPNAAHYQLNFFDRKPITEYNASIGALQLEGLYRRGIGSFRFVGFGAYADDYSGSIDEKLVYESYLTLAPSDRASYDIGKKALSWGKGYAFNPVGFVRRPKDPNDPDLSREGFIIVGGNFIRSFEGPLKTIAFTSLVIPTSDQMNEGFGLGNHANPAAKLTLLYRDTDIDFLVLGKGARSARYGFDFSRNLGTNVEIHGEWARITDVAKPVLSASGTMTTETGDVTNYLLGLRYLTERDTTWIAEYYHNGAGYTEQQMRDYFTFAHNAYDQFLLTDNTTLLERARTLQTSYARANPMQNYLYLRVGQKEPFDILYFTPSITIIQNLDDDSRSLSPELLYTGITNLELRLRLFFLTGDHLSDFGEKPNDRRFELRARYYF